VAVGLYGKLPSHGDFLQRGINDAFVNRWDAWLQEGIFVFRRELGDSWADIFLTSPVWRFALSSGVIGGAVWGGILLPSIDRVSRCFPLTIVAELPSAARPFELSVAGNSWFDWVEALARRTLDEDRVDLEQLDGKLRDSEALLNPGRYSASSHLTVPDASRPWRHDLTDDVDMGRFFARLAGSSPESESPSTTLWWSQGSDRVAPSVLILAGLPTPAIFREMLAGPEEVAQEWDGGETTIVRLEREPLPPAPALHVSSAATDPGPWREHNEDAYLERTPDAFWLVADGMGGHQHGALASRLIVDRAAVADLPGNLPEAQAAVQATLQSVNAQLRERAHSEPGFDAGSTVTAMCIRGNEGCVLWVGDTRLYRLRGGELLQLTQDHSLARETNSAPQPSESHLITRAIGGADILDLETARFDIQGGDRLLLCTDGLYSDLEPQEISSGMGGPIGDAAASLVALALARGSQDNVTAVCVECQPDQSQI
jgi:type VI secretion system protein ImpM